jgi:hypothetical protein
MHLAWLHATAPFKSFQHELACRELVVSVCDSYCMQKSIFFNIFDCEMHDTADAVFVGFECSVVLK